MDSDKARGEISCLELFLSTRRFYHVATSVFRDFFLPCKLPIICKVIPLIPEAEIHRETLPIKGEETNNIDISVLKTSKPISTGPLGVLSFGFKPLGYRVAVVGGGKVIVASAFCQTVRIFLPFV